MKESMAIMETIRKVDPQRDLEAIMEINRWYVENSTAIFDNVPMSANEMSTLITNISNVHPFYVYERAGEVRGYCYAHPWKTKMAYYPTWETTIYLHPEEKGHGIGRRLMEKLIDESREQGCHSLIACITAENEESCRFHERLGFKRVSLFKEVGEKFGRLLDVTDYQLLV